MKKWAEVYFEKYPVVRAALPKDWNLYGEPKDKNTPKFIAWRGTEESGYEYKEVFAS